MARALCNAGDTHPCFTTPLFITNAWNNNETKSQATRWREGSERIRVNLNQNVKCDILGRTPRPPPCHPVIRFKLFTKNGSINFYKICIETKICLCCDLVGNTFYINVAFTGLLYYVFSKLRSSVQTKLLKKAKLAPTKCIFGQPICARYCFE